MLTKVNYLNQRSEDRGGQGCTLEPHQGTTSSKTKKILKRIKCKPKQFTLVQSPPDLICPWIVLFNEKRNV